MSRRREPAPQPAISPAGWRGSDPGPHEAALPVAEDSRDRRRLAAKRRPRLEAVAEIGQSAGDRRVDPVLIGEAGG
jgi:hypothetical protein